MTLATSSLWAKDPWKQYETPAKVQIAEPVFRFPSEFNSPGFPEGIQSEIHGFCLNRFHENLVQLDGSIADAIFAIEPLRSQLDQIVRLLTDRLFAFIEADAVADLSLKHVAITPKKISAQVDRILQNTIGKCGIEAHGCVGSNPKVIRDAFKNGNIRERMLLIREMLWQYTGKIIDHVPPLPQNDLAHDSPEDSEHAKQKHELLRSWVAALGKFNVISHPERKAYEYGSYANMTITSNLRKKKEKEQIQSYAEKHNSTIGEMKTNSVRIPLSQREVEFLKSHGLSDSDPYPALPGQAYFEAAYNEKNSYSSKSFEYRIPQIAGISGTTDLILTFAHIMGIEDLADLEILRLAIIVQMVDARHHSIHEILTSSQSFGLNYEFSPHFYGALLPHHMEMNDRLTHEIEKRQLDRAGSLPQGILNECATERYQSHYVKFKRKGMLRIAPLFTNYCKNQWLGSSLIHETHSRKTSSSNIPGRNNCPTTQFVTRLPKMVLHSWLTTKM